jgi:hypothetical protein
MFVLQYGYSCLVRLRGKVLYYIANKLSGFKRVDKIKFYAILILSINFIVHINMYMKFAEVYPDSKNIYNFQ